MSQNKIDEIEATFFSILDDYKRYYVQFNLNPDDSESQTFYDNANNQLKSLNQELNKVITSSQTFIANNNARLTQSAQNTISEQEQYEQNLKLLEEKQQIQYGTEISVDDSKTLYYRQYYTNWAMVFSICLLCLAFYYSFFSATTANANPKLLIVSGITLILGLIAFRFVGLNIGWIPISIISAFIIFLLYLFV